jgi:hypothetical protein
MSQVISADVERSEMGAENGINESTSETSSQEGEEDEDTDTASPLPSQENIVFSPHEMLGIRAEDFARCTEMVWGKRFAIFDGGHMGIVPQQANIGDSVAVLLGCTVPLVLRSANQGSAWKLLGESYVHGAMEGEVMTEFSVETLVLE